MTPFERFHRTQQIPGLPASQKAVLVALATHADEDGWCDPSLATVAEYASLDERTARRAMGPLVEAGWIEVCRNTGTRTEYRLRFDRWPERRSASQRKRTTPDTMPPHPGHGDTPDTVTPRPPCPPTPDTMPPPPRTPCPGTPDTTPPEGAKKGPGEGAMEGDTPPPPAGGKPAEGGPVSDETASGQGSRPGRGPAGASQGFESPTAAHGVPEAQPHTDEPATGVGPSGVRPDAVPGGASTAPPHEPPVQPWTPRAAECRPHDRATVEGMVLRCIEAIQQRPVNPARAGTSAAPVLALWRKLGKPAPDAFIDELQLVARWARESADDGARNDLRGIRPDGTRWGKDRSTAVPTICVQERWDDRLADARKWAGTPAAAPPSPHAESTEKAWARIVELYTAPGAHSGAVPERYHPSPTKHEMMRAAMYAAGGWGHLCRSREKPAEVEEFRRIFIATLTQQIEAAAA